MLDHFIQPGVTEALRRLGYDRLNDAPWQARVAVDAAWQTGLRDPGALAAYAARALGTPLAPAS